MLAVVTMPYVDSSGFFTVVVDVEGCVGCSSNRGKVTGSRALLSSVFTVPSSMDGVLTGSDDVLAFS